eukprot:scaffold52411_cov34-Phaeocystis_antarctica.AAC.1
MVEARVSLRLQTSLVGVRARAGLILLRRAGATTAQAEQLCGLYRTAQVRVRDRVRARARAR